MTKPESPLEGVTGFLVLIGAILLAALIAEPASSCSSQPDPIHHDRR